MFALILRCNYFNNLHSAPAAPLLLLTTGGTQWAKSVFRLRDRIVGKLKRCLPRCQLEHEAKAEVEVEMEVEGGKR